MRNDGTMSLVIGMIREIRTWPFVLYLPWLTTWPLLKTWREISICWFIWQERALQGYRRDHSRFYDIHNHNAFLTMWVMSWFNCLLRFRLIFKLSPNSSSAVSTPAEIKRVVNYRCKSSTNSQCRAFEDAAHLCGCSFCLWYYKGQLSWWLLLACPPWCENLWSLP